MKKFLLWLISILIVGKICCLNIINNNIMISVLEPITKKTFTINAFLAVWLAFLAGIVVCLCIIASKKNTKDLNAYKNQYEKIAVSNEEQSDKVRILEEKIKSLEIALTKALEK